MKEERTLIMIDRDSAPTVFVAVDSYYPHLHGVYLQEGFELSKGGPLQIELYNLIYDKNRLKHTMLSRQQIRDLIVKDACFIMVGSHV